MIQVANCIGERNGPEKRNVPGYHLCWKVLSNKGIHVCMFNCTLLLILQVGGVIG